MTDSMSGLPLLCGVMLLVLIVYSFPVLVSGWRRKMKTNVSVRVTTIVGWSFILSLVWYVLFMGAIVAFMIVFNMPNTFVTHSTSTAYSEPDVDYEILQRFLLPLQPCYSTEQEVCDRADERMQYTESTASVGSSLAILGISFLLTLPSSVILLYFSRPGTEAVYTRHKFRVRR